MKNRLLLGPNSVSNLCIICDAYTQSVTNRFGKDRILPESFSFHPVLGLNEELCSEICNDLHPWCKPTFRDTDVDGYIENAAKMMQVEPILREMGYSSSTHASLDVSEYTANNRELWEAVRLLHSISPWIGQLFEHVVYDIYFTKKNSEVRYIGGGGSTYRLLRLIFMSFRPHEKFREVEMAISLAHELGHNCFCLLQAGARPIANTSVDKAIYSGVRKVLRPSYASFQALVAIAYMLSFSWDYYRQSPDDKEPELKSYLETRTRELYSDFAAGLSAFKQVELTEVGKVVMFEFLELKNQVKI